MAAKATQIKNGKLIPMTQGAVTGPTLRFKGAEMPKEGETLEFDPGNGVTYTGNVSEAIKDEDHIVVSFKNGIDPKS